MPARRKKAAKKRGSKGASHSPAEKKKNVNGNNIISHF
jgi:hypothetical protein